MTPDRSINRPGYLLGGSGGAPQAKQARRFISGNDSPLPYTDRKLMRFEDAPLDLETIVLIQRMACDGKRRDEILQELGSSGVTMAQISRALDPHDEHVSKPRRQERAGVGYAKVKGRYR